MKNKEIDKALCDERFDRVYDETYEQTRRYVSVKCADPHDVTDVIQDIYLEYYRLLRRKGCGYVEDDGAMIRTIASRKVKRYYSYKQRLRRLLPPIRRDEEGEEALLELPDPTTVEEAVLRQSEAEEVLHYLDRYPVEVRKIVYLYYAEEMRLDEIATAMELPLSTVKSRLYRTLHSLKTKLEGRIS